MMFRSRSCCSSNFKGAFSINDSYFAISIFNSESSLSEGAAGWRFILRKNIIRWSLLEEIDQKGKGTKDDDGQIEGQSISKHGEEVGVRRDVAGRGGWGA